MTKKVKYLLYPISLLYGCIVFIRNWLYDTKILKSAEFNFPLICVGNLAVGGTGKSPMTEYLVTILKNRYKIATLSRGYKRKTKGFAIAGELTTAIDIGDEPMQFHQKFPDITVAVGEERAVAIPQLLHDRPDTEVIILDDAFQHRMVNAGMNILLTDYSNLYTRDYMLPAGELRDVKSSAKRAQIIIITKSPCDLSTSAKEKIYNELNLQKSQKLYFTELVYAPPKHLFAKSVQLIDKTTDVLLVSGIANPKPLQSFVEKQFKSCASLKYKDHQIFTSDDLTQIKREFKKIVSHNKIILTTEKDGVRLEKFKRELEDFPIYVIPVQHAFLFNQSENFEKEIIDYINSYR